MLYSGKRGSVPMDRLGNTVQFVQAVTGGGVISSSKRKQDWIPTAESFQRLLEWLAADGAPGERYLEMRRRLVAYFDRKRCAGSDDLADETLNRVTRRLEEEGTIKASAPAQYCYVVARFVFLEYLRRSERHSIPYDPLEAGESGNAAPPPAAGHEAQPEEGTRRFDCLERCLESLPAPDRGLILEYYSGERNVKIERRRQLAGRFGLSANALTIRACRIRAKLEQCVGGCMTGHEMFRPAIP